MNTNRKTARIMGIFFITATVAGILGMIFSGPIQTPDYLINILENETQVLFTLVMAVAVAGIAISAYPVLKKQSEALALGYIGARIVEAIIFVLDAISWHFGHDRP